MCQWVGARTCLPRQDRSPRKSLDLQIAAAFTLQYYHRVPSLSQRAAMLFAAHANKRALCNWARGQGETTVDYRLLFRCCLEPHEAPLARPVRDSRAGPRAGPALDHVTNRQPSFEPTLPGALEPWSLSYT